MIIFVGKKRAGGAAAAIGCVCVMGNVSFTGQELGTIQVAMVAKEIFFFNVTPKKERKGGW